MRCGRAPRPTGTGDGSEQVGGAGGGPGSGDEGGNDALHDHVEPDDQPAMCPAAPPRPDGLREGTIPSGVIDGQQASAMFQRASHEVGHLVSALTAEPGDASSDLLGIDGDTIEGDRDGQALRGTFVRDAATGRICAAVRFASWTGGHGGWGPSALDCTMDVLIDGPVTTAVGRVGLVESGALEGAPLAQVRVEHDGELLSGSVGEFGF